MHLRVHDHVTKKRAPCTFPLFLSSVATVVERVRILGAAGGDVAVSESPDFVTPDCQRAGSRDACVVVSLIYFTC